MRTIALALTLAMTAPALAAPMSMTCQNPRHQYLITFDGSALILNPDAEAVRYLVLAATADGTVAGMVGQGSGLGFAAYFTGDTRVDLYDDDKVIQTDRCKPS